MGAQINSAVQSARQNLAQWCAAVGIVLTGFTAAEVAQFDHIDVIAVEAPMTVAPYSNRLNGTVCDASVAGWWHLHCESLDADPGRTTLLLSTHLPAHVAAEGVTIEQWRAHLTAHETRHAIHGADGPEKDPNNEKMATRAGCLQHWIRYYCAFPALWRD